MKNIMKLSVLLVLSVLLFGCKDNEEVPNLELLTENLSFSAEGGTKTVEVKTNVKGWYLILPSNDSWVTLKKGENTIQVTAPENTENEERAITIKVDAGNLTRNLKVQQMGNDASLLISSNAFSLPEEGGKVEFDITSNIPYDVVVPENTDWLKLESQTEVDESTKKFVYEVEWNNNDKGREVHLKILGKETGKGITKTISITQRGQSGYEALGQDVVKEDIKLKVVSATASSFQEGAEIEKSFDGDYNSLYHSNWSNGGANYFPIDLEYTLEQPIDELDYMIYHPRQGGSNNGIFKKVEIYTKSKDGQYIKAITKELKNSQTPVKFIFPTPVKNPESVKIRVLAGYGDGKGFASCAEMEFYAHAKEEFDILSVFTDKTCSELRADVTEETINSIPNSFYKNIAHYMKKSTYPSEFRIQEYKAWGDANIMSGRDRSERYSEIDGVTGIYAEKGEKLIIFVGDTHGETLALKFVNLDKPGGDGYNSNKSTPLSEGKNILEAPATGLIYVMYNTQDYEGKAPIKIHFATGRVNGYFDSTKHNEEDWTRLLAAAKYKYFDVVGEKAHLLFETNQYRQFCGSSSAGVSVIKQFDKLVSDEQEMMGMKKYNRVPHNRALFHVMYHSYMYSTAYRTAYNTSTVSSFLTPDGLRTSPWGPAHELGHTHQVRPLVKWIGTTECTVNIPSLYIQTGWGNKSRIQNEGRYQACYTKYFVNNSGHFEDGEVFHKLVPFWQIKLYIENAKGQTDFYKDLYEKARTMTLPDGGDGAYLVNFPVMVSEVSNMDFTDYYESWGYFKEYSGDIDDYGKGTVRVTQDLVTRAKNKIKSFGYNKPPRAVRYICDDNWTLFKHNAPIQKGTASERIKENGKIEIKMEGWKNVVAYEVKKDGKLIYATNSNKFELSSFDKATTTITAIAANDQEVQVTF
ncbi:M60 family metallopeptidase [Ornithobacterium rhinotracheale]|uniref:M60 family metallopeptidase n=1 Tax=Ornithobacterium rhinotracheale TaxID=28251 RepID=UPI001FF399E3|nr:M60 family metallopeptidase [Ornithobacterium rhinotracheale]MCK0205507.1 M60 family metallopeptidase [Ornithobacterium rhinotracheale]